MLPGAKMLDFGTPRRPAWPKMTPKIGQILQKTIKFHLYVLTLFVTYFQAPFKVLLGTILVDLGWIWDES